MTRFKYLFVCLIGRLVEVESGNPVTLQKIPFSKNTFLKRDRKLKALNEMPTAGKKRKTEDIMEITHQEGEFDDDEDNGPMAKMVKTELGTSSPGMVAPGVRPTYAVPG